MNLTTELYSISIEQIVIGCILLGEDKIMEDTEGVLGLGDFYHKENKDSYKALRDMYKKNIPIDIGTIAEYIKKEKLFDYVNLTYYFKCMETVPTIKNFEYYIKTLKDYSYKRAIAQEIGKFKIDDLNADAFLKKIIEIPRYEEIKEKTNKEVILRTLEEAEKGTDFKFPENFEDLNKITGGFDRGDLIIIGGYPSNGKTSLCNDLTVGFCNNDYRVLVITLEMSARANMRRILANTQKINTMRFRHGNLTELDKEKIKVMIPIINDVWNYHCVRAYTMPDVIRAISKHKPDIVIIDYLQNIADPENLTEYARLTKFTLQIQQIGRTKNTSVILVSQFHRPQEGKVRAPRNSDFRGSGSIEERAEIILLIYWERKLKMEALSRRDGDNPEYVRINITKNKDGETGFIQMKLYPEYHRWINWSDERDKKEVIKYENAKKKNSKYRERKDIDD